MKYIFYIKHLEEMWIGGVTDIEPDTLRNGWIRYSIVFNPFKVDIVGGGISADRVFMSGLYDY